MRRILAIGAVLAVAATVVVVLGTGASDDRRRRLPGARDLRQRVLAHRGRGRPRLRRQRRQDHASSTSPRDNRAAVVMDITRPGFDDFREDATCTIRPQSLIGEKLRRVHADPAAPAGRGAGAAPLRRDPRRPARRGPAPAAGRADVQAGRRRPLNNINAPAPAPAAGDHPQRARRRPRRPRRRTSTRRSAARTRRSARRTRSSRSSASRTGAAPARDRLRHGARAAGARPRRASRASSRTRTRSRRRPPSAARTSSATSSGCRASSQELRPTMTRLEGFADEFEPVLSDLQRRRAGHQPPGPRARPVQPGEHPGDRVARRRRGRRPPRARARSKPIIDDLGDLTERGASRSPKNLAELTVSLRDTGGIERLMDYLFFQAARDQRLRRARPLPARGPDRQHLLAVRSDAAARLLSKCAASTTTRADAPRPTARGRQARVRREGRGKAGEDHSAAALRGDVETPGRAGRRQAQPQAPTAAPSRSSCRAPSCPARRRAGAGRQARRRAPRGRDAAADGASRRPGGPARLPARRTDRERRGASVDRGEPRAHRRGDDARRHRRRVPRLQREQRPAVRADLRPQGRGARTRRTSCPATRCASAARASASSTTSRPRRTPDGRTVARAEHEARDRRPAAAATTRRSSSARARRSA